MHWVYRSKPVDDALEQGDILKKTDELVELLRNYHPYYADHPENRFFVVLTQSCDLVTRSGPCKARYIALAPARPIENVVDYEFGEQLIPIDSGRPFSSRRVEADVQRFLNRLFNNNEPSYFFLEAEPGEGLYDQMCVMLALPISFKVQHYSTFARARILGIEDSFQSKLGWLLGQLYSRVGTRDIDPKVLDAKVESVTRTLAVWLEHSQLEAMKELIAAHRAQHPGAPVDEEVVAHLIGQIPKRKTQAIESILDAAEKAGLANNPSPERRRMRLALENSSAFSVFFR